MNIIQNNNDFVQSLSRILHFNSNKILVLSRTKLEHMTNVDV